MTERRFARELGYSFAPIPDWVIEAAAAGRLSDTALRLQLQLFRRASRGALARREETPTIGRNRLTEMLRWPHREESLSRFLSRERARGHLDYRVDGSAQSGYRYVFRLFPDGPRPSDQRPTAKGHGRPTPEREESAQAGQGLRVGGRRLSDHLPPEEAASRPPKRETRPTAEQRIPPANTAPEREDSTSPSPTSSDLREKAKAVSEERVRVRRSAPPEDSTSEWLATPSPVRNGTGVRPSEERPPWETVYDSHPELRPAEDTQRLFDPDADPAGSGGEGRP